MKNPSIRKIFNKILSITVSLCLLFSIMATGVKVIGESSAEGVVTMLKTDYRTNPMGIDIKLPEFDWAINSTVRGEKQTAYEIGVATTKAKAESGDWDVWYSGKVYSDSTHLTYGETDAKAMVEGTPIAAAQLQPKTQYFWKVTAYGKDAAEIPCGEIATFETGLFGDFGADNKWISLGGDKDNYIDLSSGSVEFNVTVTKNAFGIWMFNFDTNPTSSLMWQINPAGYLSSVGPCIKPHSFGTLGNSATAATAANYAVTDENFKVGVPCTLKVEFNEGSLTTYLNGTKLGNFSIRGNSNYCYKLGKISFRTNVNETGEINSYTVRDSNGEIVYEYSALQDSENAIVEPTKYASVYFRKQFTLEQDLANVERARLYSTAAGNQIMYMNGNRASDDYMAPGKSQYTTLLYYQTYDVTSQLLEGDNTVAAEVGQGWYNAGSVSSNYGTTVGLKAKLIVTYKDGSEQIIDTDDSWNSTNEGPTTTNRYYIGQEVDGRKQIVGWNENDSNSDKWCNVVASDAFSTDHGAISTNFVGENMEPVRNTITLNPISVTNPKENVYVYKLNQNVAGTARITATASANTVMTVKYGEFLNNGDLDFVETNVYSKHNGTDKYIFRGDETGETVEFDLVYHGFQYIQIEGLTEALPFENIEALVLTSDMEETSTFETFNEDINRYMENILWSVRGNFVSTLTDCPTREKNTWTGDAQLFAATSSYFANVYNHYRNFQTMTASSQYADGAVPEIVPSQTSPSTANSPSNMIPPSGWGDCIVIIPWEMYNQYGDVTIIEENYEAMKKWISYLLEKKVYNSENPDATGISIPYYINKETADYVRLDGVYGDHLSYYRGQTGRGYYEKHTSNSALWGYWDTSFLEVGTAVSAYSCNILSQMAEVIGETEDAAYYKDLYQKFAAAWRANFVSSDGNYTSLADGVTTTSTDQEGNTVYSYSPDVTRTYNGVEYENLGSQTSYAMGLYFDLYLNEDGTVNEEAKLKAAQNLANLMKRDNYSITVGFMGINYIFHVLSQNGQFDTAMKALENENYPSLLSMVKAGATSIWETYEGNMSQNHYIYGAPGRWLFSDILGISHNYQSENAGYSHFELNPNYASYKDTSVNWAKGSYISVNGTIESSWSLSDDRNTFTYNCTVPANTTATLALPVEEDDAVITESGIDIANALGVEFIESKGGKYYYELSSGSFEFVVSYSVSEHTCVASEEWYSDGNGNHYHKCTANDRCNERFDITACSGGNATCFKKAECLVCGGEYGELASHIYVQNTTADYIVSGATEEKEATYYESCKYCGVAGSTVFERKPKNMLHVNVNNTGTGRAYDKLGVGIAEPLEAGEKYIISLNYEGSYPVGGFRMTFNVTGKNDNYHLYEDKWLATSYSSYVSSTVPTTLITAEKSGKNAVYTFTPTEAQAIYSYYYLEFYVVSDAGETFDFYVSDLTMYKASDPDKKNILGSDAYSSDLSNWYYGTGKCSGTQFSYGRFSNIEWVDYDPSIFKTIFHLNMNYTGAGNDRFGVLLNQPLETGVKYKVSFNYTSDTSVYNSNIRFSIAGANQGSSLWDIVGLCNSNKDIMQGTLMIDKSPGNTMEYEFTLKPEQAVYSNYFAWFYVNSDVAAEFDIYLSDFKLYRVDDTEKTNLLPTSDQANDLTGWCWTYGKMSGNAWTNSSRMTLAEFVPYGSGDANFDKEFDIRDLVRIDEQITVDSNKARNPLGDINADDILNMVDLNACHQKLLNLK